MSTVKITSTIDIADSAPSLPIVTVVEGEIRDDLSDHVANRLIELDCAKLVEEKPADDEPENTSDATDDNGSDAENTDETDNSDDNGDDDAEKGVMSTPESLKAELEDIALKSMDDPMGSEQKTKAELETLAKERYGFDVDKRMSVDNIILAIVEAAFKE